MPTEAPQAIQTGQPPNPKQAAQNLVQSMEQGQQQPPQETQLPEGFKPEEFNKTLKAVTGIESYEKIPEIRSAYEQMKSQYDQLQAEYGQAKSRIGEFEAKQKLSPFANPFVEKLNGMFSEETPREQINKFMYLHSQDIDGMDYGKAVALKLQMENPSLDEDDVDYKMEEMFGALPAEDDENYSKVAGKIANKLKVAGKEAKNWLKQQMASFDDPGAQQARQEANQKKEAHRQAWETVAGRMAASEASLSHKLEDEKIGGTYAFEYNPKLSEEQSSQVSKMIADYAIQNNLPLNESSLPKLREYRQAILRTMFMDDYINHMLRDAFASFQEHFVKQYSAPGQIQKGSAPPNQEPEKPEKLTYKARQGFI